MLAGGRDGAIVKGAIVNVGSLNSFLGFAFGVGYCASKHGLIGLTTCASAELAPQGIRVNLVCPGFIDTPMHHRARGIVGDDIYDKQSSYLVAHQASGTPAGDRTNNRPPLFRRVQLHLRHHRDAGRWLYANDLTYPSSIITTQRRASGGCGGSIPCRNSICRSRASTTFTRPESAASRFD